MISIGVTGGVGAGKSAVLSYIKDNYNCIVMVADEIAHELERKGNKVYDSLVSFLGENILSDDGEIDKKKMALTIFSDGKLLQGVNDIVHPAVKQHIIDTIEAERNKGVLDFVIVEAALLIENGFEEILDEMWYVFADCEVRIDRLIKTRGYSREKALSIIDSQLSDEEFRNHCNTVIDNSGDIAVTKKQIDCKLGEYLWQTK